MPHWKKFAASNALAAVILIACQTRTPIETVAETPEVTTTVADEADTQSCPIIDSRNWSARIDRMPGPGAVAMLKVSGEIDLPTPGYIIIVTEGRADRSAIPMQDLTLELTPPDGIVMQVVTPEDVYFEGAAIAEKYRGVRIMCHGELVKQIDTIDEVS